MIRIAKKAYNKEEIEKAKKYHDTFEAKQELYELMKKIMIVTDHGYEDDDYTKTVNLDIGDGTLSYDPYYQKLTYYDSNDCECEVKEDDLETVQNLIKELGKRFEAFEKGIKERRKNLAEGFFSKPIDKILKQE